MSVQNSNLSSKDEVINDELDYQDDSIDDNNNDDLTDAENVDDDYVEDSEGDEDITADQDDEAGSGAHQKTSYPADDFNYDDYNIDDVGLPDNTFYQEPAQQIQNQHTQTFEDPQTAFVAAQLEYARLNQEYEEMKSNPYTNERELINMRDQRDMALSKVYSNANIIQQNNQKLESYRNNVESYVSNKHKALLSDDSIERQYEIRELIMYASYLKQSNPKYFNISTEKMIDIAAVKKYRKSNLAKTVNKARINNRRNSSVTNTKQNNTVSSGNEALNKEIKRLKSSQGEMNFCKSMGRSLEEQARINLARNKKR